MNVKRETIEQKFFFPKKAFFRFFVGKLACLLHKEKKSLMIK